MCLGANTTLGKFRMVLFHLAEIVFNNKHGLSSNETFGKYRVLVFYVAGIMLQQKTCVWHRMKTLVTFEVVFFYFVEIMFQPKNTIR